MILSLLLFGMVFVGAKTYGYAKAYEERSVALASYMSAENLAEYQLKELAESVSFGLYRNKEKTKVEKLVKEQRDIKAQAQKYTFYFMLLFSGVLVSFFTVSLRAFTFFGSLGAFLALFYGLITPILMLTIHKKVEYLGNVVLSFESKGVLGSIVKLFDNGDSVVAAVILLFSVLVPTIKILSILFVSLFMQSRFAHGIVKFFKTLGKWSMVDVFVVATFLVYLTGNGSDVSHAEVQVGLYFFLSYVIVSMIVSFSADKMLSQNRSV